MTTILTPTANGITVQSSLGQAKVGRFCAPPQVPDQCYKCCDVVNGAILFRPATGYVEETLPGGRVWRYGACPSCWSRRAKTRYLQWVPAGTNHVYRAALLEGRWHVYGFNKPAAYYWTDYSKQGYLDFEFIGPWNNTTVYLTDKAVAEATEFFLVQDEAGGWRSVHADGSPTICFHCGQAECDC